MICPNCGADTKDARRKVRQSAEDLVESLRIDTDLLDWCNRNAPEFDPAFELENFKLRMRANGYKVGRNLVRDAKAAFQYHMKNAKKFGFPMKATKPPIQIAKKDL